MRAGVLILPDYSPRFVRASAAKPARCRFRRAIDSYSAFRENDRRTPTGLAGYLKERGFERLSLCGLAADFCIFFSAIDGREAGFEVEVVTGACRGIDVDGSLARAMRSMRDAGVVLLTD